MQHAAAGTKRTPRGGEKFHPSFILGIILLNFGAFTFQEKSCSRLLTFLLNLIFSLFQSKRELLIKIALQQKEIEILNRKRGKKRALIRHADRILLVVLNRVGEIKDSISIVKPETVLFWQRELIKKFWTFPSSKHPGRPQVSEEIKQLILGMKNDNIYWGNKKIQGELLKLGISLDKNTIRNIVDYYRRLGKVKKSLSWKKFLSAQAHAMYAMDFFTVDTLLKERYYVLFIIHHKTREIVQFAITQNPTREFLRQQMIEFSQNLNTIVYMIHDNAQEFVLNYLLYDIKQICTSVNAPNISVRKEATNPFRIEIYRDKPVD